MPKYVVMDDLNQWLVYGDFGTFDEAFEAAQTVLRDGDFELPSELNAFEVVSEQTMSLELPP